MSNLKTIPMAVFWVLMISLPLAAAELTPRQILDRVDDLYRGESAHGKLTMKVKTEHWAREMTAEFWSLGKEKSLIRILAPKKEKGTATLKNGNKIWNYLPKVKRTIKVPSSMMGGSWMGSHFTNDDLIKESRMADDYDFSIGFQGEREGQKIIEIICKPKEDAAVVWGKVVVEVLAEGYLPVKQLYYDEDMNLARTMVFSAPQKMGDRIVPSLMRVVPTDKPSEFTEVKYDEMKFDVKLSNQQFSLRALQR